MKGSQWYLYLWSMGAFPDSGASVGAGAGAGLSNFWKNRVRVRQGATIKKLFKIFLFIFSIYFKGKNIFLFWESMQATNDNKYISLLGKHANMLFYIFSICYPFHFKYIFKGKKHNKKENTKEVSCLGLIQNQFWPVSAIGRYNLIRSIRPDSGRIGPVRCEFVKKKKKP